LCFKLGNAFAVNADDYVYRILTTAKHARVKANDHVPVFQQWLSINDESICISTTGWSRPSGLRLGY
jgi:hypothetical protein